MQTSCAGDASWGEPRAGAAHRKEASGLFALRLRVESVLLRHASVPMSALLDRAFARLEVDVSEAEALGLRVAALLQERGAVIR